MNLLCPLQADGYVELIMAGIKNGLERISKSFEE
jgi:hypothetical protein